MLWNLLISTKLNDHQIDAQHYIIDNRNILVIFLWLLDMKTIFVKIVIFQIWLIPLGIRGIELIFDLYKQLS